MPACLPSPVPGLSPFLPTQMPFSCPERQQVSSCLYSRQRYRGSLMPLPHTTLTIVFTDMVEHGRCTEICLPVSLPSFSFFLPSFSEPVAFSSYAIANACLERLVVQACLVWEVCSAQSCLMVSSEGGRQRTPPCSLPLVPAWHARRPRQAAMFLGWHAPSQAGPVRGQLAAGRAGRHALGSHAWNMAEGAGREFRGLQVPCPAHRQALGERPATPTRPSPPAPALRPASLAWWEGIEPRPMAGSPQ